MEFLLMPLLEAIGQFLLLPLLEAIGQFLLLPLLEGIGQFLFEFIGELILSALMESFFALIERCWVSVFPAKPRRDPTRQGATVVVLNRKKGI